MSTTIQRYVDDDWHHIHVNGKLRWSVQDWLWQERGYQNLSDAELLAALEEKRHGATG